MKKQAIGIILVLGILLSMLTACGSAPAEAAPTEASADPLQLPDRIIVEADGRAYTFEDAEVTQIRQLLAQANIPLQDGDVLCLDADQTLSDTLTVRLLRQHTVSVVVADANGATRHNAVLMEGTVADALAVVGVELTENSTVNFELNTALEDGMEIIIAGDSTVFVPAPVEDPTVPAETTPQTGSSQTGKTIVSVEVYEDCDGSGHGIKVITYSDGTQEEVMF